MAPFKFLKVHSIFVFCADISQIRSILQTQNYETIRLREEVKVVAAQCSQQNGNGASFD